MPERQLREHLSPPALLVHCRDTRGDAPAARAPSASRQNTDTQRGHFLGGERTAGSLAQRPRGKTVERHPAQNGDPTLSPG